MLTPEIVEDPTPLLTTLIGLLDPAPVTLPASEIFPVPELRMAGELNVPLFVIPVFASPRVMLALVVAIVPWVMIEAGAVTSRPLVNVEISELPLPSVTVPVLRNVVAPPMVLFDPVIDTL